MSIQPVLQIGDPILLAPAKLVKKFNSPELKQLVEDLTDTMHYMGLTGLAAPQLGESLAVFVTEIYPNKNRPEQVTDPVRVYINPRFISKSSEECIIYEGCGSVVAANFSGPVSRPNMVTVEAEGLNGKTFRLRADGLLGRVIQHEYDHLQGMLFTELITDYRKILDFANYKKYIRNSKEQVENAKISVVEVS